MSFFQSSLVMLAGLRLVDFRRRDRSFTRSGMTGHRSRFKGRYFMFSHRCTLRRKRKLSLIFGRQQNSITAKFGVTWWSLHYGAACEMNDRIRINPFFFSNNHATPSKAAVGLKLQPQCKKLSDSDGVFFNRTAKKVFQVNNLNRRWDC